MTEQQLTDAIVELCRYLGVLVHHDRPSRTERGWRTAIQGDPGFPDLVLAGPRGVLYRELKSARGRMRPEQATWATRLMGAGANWATWTPADWPTRIRAEIEAVARP